MTSHRLVAARLAALFAVMALAAPAAAPRAGEDAATPPPPCPAAKPMVILKLDDVNGRVNDRWKRVVALLEEKDVKANFGIIGKSLAKDDAAYFQWIKDLAASGRVEFWNHGYGLDQKGVREFETDDFAQQRDSLEKTQRLAREKLGLTLVGFGPDSSGANHHTARALKDFPEIKLVFNYLVSLEHRREHGIVALPRYMDMEHGTFVPNFPAFRAQYEQIGQYLPAFSLQGHPNSWNDERWDNFAQIVDFLQKEGCRLVTISEYLAAKAAADAAPCARPAPAVVLRVDELGGLPHQRWEAFFQLLKDKDVKATVGVTGGSLDDPDPKYVDYLRNLAADGRIELYNKAFAYDDKGPDGRPAPRDAAAELEILTRTQAAAREKLGVEFRAFAVPWGQIRSKAIPETLARFPEIRAVFGAFTSADERRVHGKAAFPAYVNFEHHRTDAAGRRAKFVLDWEMFGQYLPVVVVPLTPQYWREDTLRAFGETLDFLKARGCRFPTVSEYLDAAPPAKP